jgi:hypothetical protein
LSGRLTDLIALKRKAGEAVAGFEKVKDWLAAGNVAVLLQATDGSERGKSKLWTPTGRPLFQRPDGPGIGFGIRTPKCDTWRACRWRSGPSCCRGGRKTAGPAQGRRRSVRRERRWSRMSDHGRKKTPWPLWWRAVWPREPELLAWAHEERRRRDEAQARHCAQARRQQSAAAQNAEGGKCDKALPDAELERRLRALQAAKAREAEDEERRADRREVSARKNVRAAAPRPRPRNAKKREREEALKAKEEEDRRRREGRRRTSQRACRRRHRSRRRRCRRPRGRQARARTAASPAPAPARRKEEDDRAGRGRGARPWRRAPFRQADREPGPHRG